MVCYTPSLDPVDASRALAGLLKPVLNPDACAYRIQSLQRMFSAACASCPSPFAGYGLRLTPEINYQCEHWLPLDVLREHFFAFYRQALNGHPVLTSTPYARAASWAAIVSSFPPFLRHVINPAALLRRLMVDTELRVKFLFWSFLPERFYGDGSDRYPGQVARIGAWIRSRELRGRGVRCLDAACGDGATAYGLARLFMEQGWLPDRFAIEGWTLDPLEVWAAAHGIFPHNPRREASFRAWRAPVFQGVEHPAMLFRAVDLNALPGDTASFDLIVCNGLLGGPIINRPEEMQRVVSNLCHVLAPGGMLLVADHFHGGWKQKYPQQSLRVLCEGHGLVAIEAAEGIAVLKPD